MRSARPAARAERAGHILRAGSRDPSAAGVPAAPTAEGGGSLAGAAWPLAVGVAWLVLAFRSPHVTYHIAPFLAAASWPAVLRVRSRAPVAVGRAAIAAAGALGVTLVVASTLAVGGALGGPSVWHGSGALETPLVAAAGTIWGWRAAVRHRGGVLGLLA